MWSYPNMLPLPAAAVQRIGAALEPWTFDRIYGAFSGRQLLHDAKPCIRRSVQRYVALLQGEA